MIAVLHLGKSETHVVEVYASYWTGQDIITVDGTEVLRTRPFQNTFKWKQRLAFEVGESEKHAVEIVYGRPGSAGKAYVDGRLHNGCLFPQALAFTAFQILWGLVVLVVLLQLIMFIAVEQRLSGSSSYNQGVEALDKKDYDLAITHLTQAIQETPKDHIYNKRGIAYRKKGEHDLAIADFNEAIRLNPENLWAYAHRGNAYFDKKDYDQALADYRQAYRLDPHEPHEFFGHGYSFHHNHYIGMAWLLATCPDDKVRDGKAAVRYATKACEASDWKDPHCLNALAAAHAEAGDFKEAVMWQMKALDTTGLSPEAVEKARARLDLYKADKPYRDSSPYRF